ncbi:MAG: hypothetical protein CTY12_04640, partial [Methylotenera sp.]
NGRILTTNGTSTSWAVASSGTVTSVGVSGGTTGLTTSGGPITGSGTITLTGTLGVTNGGTGLTGVVVGNILYGSGTNTLAALTAGAAGTVLTSAGAAAPTWNKVALSSIADIGQLSVLGRSIGSVGPVDAINASSDNTVLRRSGSDIGFGSINLGSVNTVGTSILIAVNGGTGQSTYTVGDILYSGSLNTLTKLTGNITTTKQFLSQTGTGIASAAPIWSTVTKSDVGLNLVENTALSTWVGSSNITTLGTISTGTWNATNISIAKGGTGLSTTPTNGQLLIGNGTGYSLATLTPGSGVTITNGTGTITIASTGGSSVSVYDTEAWVVGRNTTGQAGLNDITNRSAPIQIGADINWKQLSGGSLFTIGIKYDGTLWAWGSNTLGQLGDGTTTNRSSPIQIGSLTDWKQISGGNNHVAALKTDGTLWAWGSNNFGQFGNGTTTSTSSPIQIGSLDAWLYISAGNSTTSLIKKDGSLWVCGYNGVGQLGDGTTTNRSSPVQVGSLTDWKQVSMGGGYSTLAIKSNGTLWGWGLNSFGEVGNGTITQTSSPVQIGSLTDWKQVACGYQHTVAVRGNGTLWSWGLNTSGQLGDGTTTNRSSPVQVGSLNTWRQVDCGFIHAVARKVDGTGWSWGANSFGQLGDNTVIGKSSPVQISSNLSWTDISASYPGTSASSGATTYLLTDSTPIKEITEGGTGLREIGIANQSLVVNPTGSGLEYKTLNNHGTAVVNFGPTPGSNITNVVVTGQTGITTNSFINTRIQYNGPIGITVGDGFNWVGKPHGIWSGTNYGSTCVTGGNGVYLVGNVDTASAEIQRSTDDGMTWTSSYTNVAYGAIVVLTYDIVTNTFYAVSSDGYIMSSTDSGTTWGTAYNISGLFFPSSISINGTTIVITSSAGSIFYTTTGISGTWSSILGSTPINGSTFGDGLFVVVGASGSILTSPDGSTWTVRNSGLTLENNIQWTDDLFDVTYGNGVFVAVGMNGRCITSSNGINWTKQHSVFGNRPPISNLTSIFDGTANKAFSIAFGNGVFVAVGSAGQIAKSLNGKQWIQAPKRSGFARFLNIDTVERTGNNTFVIVSGQDTELFAISSDLSLDHNMSEHCITPINTFISNITPDVGFTIEATSTYLLSGTYTVKWSWSN